MSRPITTAEKKRCAEREARMRERVYARQGWTDKRRRELAVMRAIAEDYARQLDAETPSLFGHGHNLP